MLYRTWWLWVEVIRTRVGLPFETRVNYKHFFSHDLLHASYSTHKSKPNPTIAELCVLFHLSFTNGTSKSVHIFTLDASLTCLCSILVCTIYQWGVHRMFGYQDYNLLHRCECFFLL